MLCEKSPDIVLRLHGVEPCAGICWDKMPSCAEVKGNLLYCFGLSGSLSSALQWLEAEKSRLVILLCHDASHLKRWLFEACASRILSDERTRVYLFDASDPDDPLFQWLFAEYAGQTAEVVATEWAQGRFPLIVDFLKAKLLGESALASRALSEFLRFGDAFYQNFYSNIGHLDGSIQGSALFGAFSGTPAIVCGAGPSLSRQRELFAGLMDRALVFAGGSALNGLSAGGFLPHFGVGVDPYYPQYQRLMTACAFTVPMFFQLRWYWEALKLWDGPHIYLRGSAGYPIASEIEERLGVEGDELEGGQNVVHLCIDIARALGCDPIILVGLDLCYEGTRHYADGVLTDARDEMPRSGHPYDLPITDKDREGDTVYTHWKWLAERDYIATYAEAHPELTLVNATGRGLEIPYLPHMPLEDVASEYLQRAWPLDSMVHAALATAPLIEAPHEVSDLFCKEIEESLLGCRQMLIDLQGPIRGGQRALLEVELGEELAHRLILSGLAGVHEVAGQGDLDAFLLEAIEHQLQHIRGRG